MSMSQSKLMLQLQKQQKLQEKTPFSEQKIEDLYTTISKIEPKNLMLVQFLTLMIEKSLIKNSHKIETLVEMFDQIKGKKLDQQHNSFSMMSQNRSPTTTQYSNNMNNSTANPNQALEKEQQKFNKKKFLKLLKDVAKMLYPGDPKAYESTLYLKLVMPEQQENRMKVDDNLKKFLNQQVIAHLAKYSREFQTLFEVYMPQNYNSKLGFSWNQIRLLEKKLPIMCLVRILSESEISPQLISPTLFLETISKMIPPLNTNQKQAMFYCTDNFNPRDSPTHDQIKLINGDIGLTFFQFTMVLARVATEIVKDGKQEVTKAIDKLMATIGATQTLRQKKQIPKMNKLQTVLLNHFRAADKNTTTSATTTKYIKKKPQAKKENEELNTLLDDSDSETKPTKNPQADLPFKKLEHQSIMITKDDLYKMKRNLDDQLGPVPEKFVVDKENQGYFNVNEKFTVIGDQLPKLQEKNKPAAKPNPKDKKEDPLFGFKAEDELKLEALSKDSLMLNRKKKLRLNTEHPVILSEVFYPTSFSDPSMVPIKEQQEVYLETTYIHLGERMYEEAYVNFQKAQRIMKAKRPHNFQSTISDKKASLMLEFYLEILEAQIFEAAGKDEAAMVHYYNARQISFNFSTSQLKAKAFAYMGLSTTLYHLQEYEFSLRCLLKAKEIYADSLEVQSTENAILLNNVGCCYMMMNRNQQAIKYFNLSHQVLDLKVGRFDQRTLVVQQNISKNKKAFIEQMPSFKTMWKTYVQKGSARSGAKPAKKVAK